MPGICSLATEKMATTTKKKSPVPGPYALKHLVAGPVPENVAGLTLKLALILALISVAVYANSLWNGFAMDDTVMLTHNTFVARGVSGIPELLATPHQRGYKIIANDEYRPLSLVLLALEYQVWGLEPWPYHLVNILLFAGCVVLLFFFLNDLFARKKTVVAFIAAALFALHPVHTEAVANIKSCDELLAFLLAFLSMNLFIAYTASGLKSQLAAGLACLFLSLLSKETAITFLGIIPLVFFLFLNDSKKRSIQITAGAIAVAVTFIVIRSLVLNYYHTNTLQYISIVENMLADSNLSPASRIATAVFIMGYYIKLLFVPYPLVCDYSLGSIPYVTFANPGVLITLVIYIGLGLFCLLRFLRQQKDPYAFAVAFFLFTISLFTNIFFMIKSTAGERLLFFPSAGFCLVVSLLICRWASGNDIPDITILKRPKALGVLIPLCLIYVLITVSRNSDWANDMTLYKADVEKKPENCRLNYYHGYNLFEKYKEETDPAEKETLLNEAILYYRRALAVYPVYEYALADLGAAYFCTGQLDSAEIYDSRALHLHPDEVLTRNNLSGVFMKEKKYQAVVTHGKETIHLLPANVFAYADIGVAYLQLGSYDSALLYLDKGIATAPEFFGCYDVKGTVYHAMGKEDSAKKYKEIAQSVYNDHK